MRPFALSLVLAALVALPACKTTDPFESEASHSGDLTADRTFLWDVSKATVERSGYILDTGETDETAGVLQTRWREHLAPFRYQGARDRVTIKLLPVKEGRYEVAVRVQTQRNKNLESPLEPVKAEWEDADPDAIRTEQILFRIRNYFHELGTPPRSGGS